MKRLVFGLIMTVILAGTLVGCGTKNDTDEKDGNKDVENSTDNKEDLDNKDNEQKTDEEDNDSEAGNNEEIIEGDTIIVGTEAGFAPYEYMKGNEVVGIDMDIAKAIADSMGKKLEIKNMEFEGALIAVQNGNIDFVAAGVSIDEGRAKVMDFTTEYVNSTEVVVVNKDNPIDIDDLDGKIIGVQQGNIADFWVEDNLDAKDIKRYTKFVQAAEDLKNERIDCIVMDQYPAQELVESNDKLEILEGTLFEDKYAIAVKKGNTELLEQINTVIEQLIADGKIEEFTANHTNK